MRTRRRMSVYLHGRFLFNSFCTGMECARSQVKLAYVYSAQREEKISKVIIIKCVVGFI